MKKKLYYTIPFVTVPLLLLICEMLDNINILQMSPYTLGAVLLLFSVAMGLFSTTHRTFDYLLTAIMPISLFCFMFVVGFLGKSDLETRFHLYKAVNSAFQPIALLLYFLMAITTFFASFKGFRNLKKLFSKKLNCENRVILKKISISAIAVLYDIATVIWYYIAIKNFIFVFKSLSYVGIIGIHDWKAALSLMFKFGYIWDLILAILFTALNTIIAVLLTRMALGKQFSKKLKILLCVLLGILLVFFILVPFYTYLWALYAVFRRIRLISVFGFVYFVIIVGALAFNTFELKSKDTKDFLQQDPCRVSQIGGSKEKG